MTPRSAWQRFAAYRTEYPSTDWVVAGALVAGHMLVAWKLGRGDVLYSMGLERRLDLYGNAISLTGTLVGFTLTSFTFYYAATGDLMTTIRERIGESLSKQWLVALRLPMAALAVLFIIKSTDGVATPGHYGAASNVRWLFELTAVLVAFRFYRLVGVFTRIARVRAMDEQVAAASGGARPEPMDIPRSPARR